MKVQKRTGQIVDFDLEKIGNLSLFGDIDLKYRTNYYLINIL